MPVSDLLILFTLIPGGKSKNVINSRVFCVIFLHILDITHTHDFKTAPSPLIEITQNPKGCDVPHFTTSYLKRLKYAYSTDTCHLLVVC